MAEVEEVTLNEIWRVIVARVWTVAIAVLFTTGVAVAYALLVTPVYRASILMSSVIENDNASGIAGLTGGFGDIASLVGLGAPQGGRRIEAIATLQSRSFLTTFIDSRNLLPVLFEDQWDAGTSRWRAEDDDIPTLSDGYRLFSEELLTISEDRLTKLITLSIMWRDGEIAAKWANELISEVNALLQRRTIEEANKTVEFLNQQLAMTNVVDLQQLIYRLIETQVNKATIANARDQYAFKVLDPAVPPEPDDVVSPQRLLTIMVGMIFGLISGCIIALSQSYHQKVRITGSADRSS